MVTEEQQAVIEKLELELASKEKPCPECYDFEAPPIRLPDGTLQASDCTAEDCNGSGVVPLIDDSREECMFQPSFLATWHYGEGCPRYTGRGWIPALDGWKVLAWMVSFGFSYIRLATDELYPGKIKSLFIFNGRDVLIEAKDPEEALLRACLAVIEAMNAEMES